ncbi:MAG: DUF177 domain-containing protein [Planctomycetota bacterium]|jgi:uncharacterized protein|nr:DUF177 domain-containing protein [Planctomycetota bacterium]
MKINVEGISQGSRTIEEDYTARQLGIEDSGLQFEKRINVSAEVTRMGEEVYVHSVIRTNLQQQCCRCLEDFGVDVDTQFQGLFVPFKQPASIRKLTQRRRLLDDDGKVTPYRGKVINLSSDILNAIRMMVPMKPLCEATCKGLCADCGVNRNQEKCACGERSVSAGYNPFKELQTKFQE